MLKRNLLLLNGWRRTSLSWSAIFLSSMISDLLQPCQTWQTDTSYSFSIWPFSAPLYTSSYSKQPSLSLSESMTKWLSDVGGRQMTMTIDLMQRGVQPWWQYHNDYNVYDETMTMRCKDNVRWDNGEADDDGDWLKQRGVQPWWQYHNDYGGNGEPVTIRSANSVRWDNGEAEMKRCMRYARLPAWATPNMKVCTRCVQIYMCAWDVH